MIGLPCALKINQSDNILERVSSDTNFKGSLIATYSVSPSTTKTFLTKKHLAKESFEINFAGVVAELAQPVHQVHIGVEECRVVER